MKESFWAYFIVVLGMIAIAFIFLFQTLTSTDEQLMTLLDESVKGAMYDAVDFPAYREDETIRIDADKFVENFLRRFSQNASLSRTYKVKIFDVNELPPKVSIRVSTIESGTLISGGGKTSEEVINYTVSNSLDAIIEVPEED